ncbi:hypothetical protein BDZ97DRAFT_474671 [Flammula alnicola]|nr:hypothetical protein BDZ97DRAFT_474671 [Flammula alnicola]
MEKRNMGESWLDSKKKSRRFFSNNRVVTGIYWGRSLEYTFRGRLRMAKMANRRARPVKSSERVEWVAWNMEIQEISLWPIMQSVDLPFQIRLRKHKGSGFNLFATVEIWDPEETSSYLDRTSKPELAHFGKTKHYRTDSIFRNDSSIWLEPCSIQ